MEEQKLKIKLEIDTSEAHRQMDEIIERAKATRRFLEAVEKGPIAALVELCRDLLEQIPDAAGKYEFVWEQMSNEERAEVTDAREAAEVILGHFEGEADGG